MIPLSGRAAAMAEFEGIRKEFEAKLATRGADEDVVTDTHMRRRSSSVLFRSEPEVVSADQVLGVVDPGMKFALAEILGQDELNDPLLVELREMDAATSLDAFIEGKCV
jgi:hypothetical protein